MPQGQLTDVDMIPLSPVPCVWYTPVVSKYIRLDYIYIYRQKMYVHRYTYLYIIPSLCAALSLSLLFLCSLCDRWKLFFAITSLSLCAPFFFLSFFTWIYNNK